jgi:putative nucleotidyltransferase with HDIG domain
MDPTFPSLRGVVAKRILGLFLLCALLPVVSLAALSIREMSVSLTDQTDQRLRQVCKNIDMAIHQGFSPLHIELAALAISPGGLRSSGAAERNPLLARERHFRGLTLFRQRSEAEPLFGNPCPFPPWTDALRKHLASGKGAVFVQGAAGAPSRAYMAVAADRRMPEQGILVGEIHPAYLREITENAMPSEGNLAILDPDGGSLISFRPFPAAVARRVKEEARRTFSGRFEWDADGEPSIVSYRSIFLQANFLSGDWTVVVSQSRGMVFAAVKTFTRTFVLIVVLTLLVVSLLSLVQIRRSLVPLAKLQEGTQKISRGDFDSRVEVASGDEFEELAGSFNAMSDRLAKQFEALAGTGRIVRSVLTALDKEKIAEVVIANLGSVIPCDRFALSLMDGPGAVTARTYVHAPSAGNSPEPVSFRTIFTPEEIQRLGATVEALTVKPGDGFESLISSMSGKDFSTFHLLPVFHKDVLNGVLALEYGNGPGREKEDLIRGRQIADQVGVALANAHLVEELDQLNWGTLVALARTVDAKSPWTAGHSERVTNLSLKIGKAMGLPAEDLELLHRAGLLHDIGKIGVPGAILDKPEKLTDAECASIRQHPEKGALILEPIPAYREVVPIVAQHHEWFDGKGYPRGLSGEAILLGARIIAVADVFDALTSKRPYRSEWSADLAMAQIEELAGRQFDPFVVRVFRRIDLGGNSSASGYPERLAGDVEVFPRAEDEDPPGGIGSRKIGVRAQGPVAAGIKA